jgi:hypothetical protein
MYRFLTRHPGTLGWPRSVLDHATELDFPNDDDAINDARRALADAARDAILTQRPAVDEIEVSSPTGVVIATVTLREDEKR